MFPLKIIGPTGLFLFHLKSYMFVFVSSKVIGSKLDYKVRTFVTKDRLPSVVSVWLLIRNLSLCISPKSMKR